MKNIDIRAEAQAADVQLWRIARALGMRENNFSRKLREELSPEEKGEIRKIIAQLKEAQQ